MTDLLASVKVTLLVDDEPLPEFVSNENEEQDTDVLRTRYVEAVDDKTFYLRVSVPTTFAWKGAQALRVSMLLDGQSKRTWRIERASVENRSREGHAFYHQFFRYFKSRNEDMQKTECRRFSFGKLHTYEDQQTSSEIKPDSLVKLGLIDIGISRRGMVSVTPRPKNWSLAPRAFKELPEKALKGRPIESNVQFGEAFVSLRSEPAKLKATETTSITTAAGKKVPFRFQYRSRNALQILGYIPRDSPDPEITPITSFASAASPPRDQAQQLSDKDEEIRRLRAQLAALEGTGNAQEQQEVQDTITSVKREAPEPLATITANLKHEANDVPGSRQRKKRRAGQIECVDLTGD